MRVPFAEARFVPFDRGVRPTGSAPPSLPCPAGAGGRRLGPSLALLLALVGCSERAPADPTPTSRTARAATRTAGAAPLAPVHFDELRAFLPREVAGFTTARDEGSTGKYGEVAISEAERTFVPREPREDAGEDAELVVRIVDSTLSPRLGASIHDAITFGRAHPGGEGTPHPLDGVVGFVRYDPRADQAEGNVLVAERYVVAVTASGFGDTHLVREVLARFDLAALSRLR